jgi:hypothetical protein
MNLLFFPGLHSHLTQPPVISLWGYIKAHVYMLPMPHDLPQLLQRFKEAAAATDHEILQHVWQELHYRIDLCHVTNGRYIEHL